MQFGKPAHIYVDVPKPVPAPLFGPVQKPEPVAVPVEPEKVLVPAKGGH